MYVQLLNNMIHTIKNIVKKQIKKLMICIVQARMSSRRLPNKVLKKIYKYNNVFNRGIVNKFQKIPFKKISRTIIATSTLRSDDKIEKIL